MESRRIKVSNRNRVKNIVRIVIDFVFIRWFEVLILLLLLTQWILMSFVPVLFNKDPALFTRNGDFLLLVIYIIYT